MKVLLGFSMTLDPLFSEMPQPALKRCVMEIDALPQSEEEIVALEAELIKDRTYWPSSACRGSLKPKTLTILSISVLS